MLVFTVLWMAGIFHLEQFYCGCITSLISYLIYIILIANYSGSQFNTKNNWKFVLIAFLSSFPMVFFLPDKTSIIIVYSCNFLTFLIFILMEFQAGNEFLAVQLEKAIRKHDDFSAIENLNSHFDPHFFFNSLNTLNSLLDKDPVKAKTFSIALSKIYSQIIRSRQLQYVSVIDELALVREYITLMQIRFGEEAIHYELTINEFALEHVVIPPCSLQILLENCFKHNIFGTDQPIHIKIIVGNEEIAIINPVRLKSPLVKSHGTGLENLDQRFQLLINKGISIENQEDFFTVKMPFKKI
ncbi:MAG: histidine kinase [Chitinophagaceae bacterium]|nr:histidine kinase [Chitinophagaceae bacterium]